MAIPGARKQGDALSLVRRVPDALVPALRTAVPPLPDHVAARIRAELPAFAGTGHDRLHPLIREAVAVATDGFLGVASGDEASQVVVESHFRGLGRAEALAGLGAHRVLAAIHIAGDSVWQALRAIVEREDLEGRVVADLAAAVTRYLAHLSAQVQHGFAEEREGMLDARNRLVAALLRKHGEEAGVIAELAEAAGWVMPEEVAVVVAQLHGVAPRQLAALSSDSLVRSEGDRMVVVAHESQVCTATEALLDLGPRVVVAHSWAVATPDARHAYRWARRALTLAGTGTLRAEGRVIDCAAHRMALWLAADQPLAHEISEDVLAPLRAVTPRRRLALGETLLGRLGTDESVPALAHRLGVHPNTVRSRLGALQDMFGERLRQPEHRTALILVLEAAVPRWRAELGLPHR
jgi:hypothetical protein